MFPNKKDLRIVKIVYKLDQQNHFTFQGLF
jgi:hypothetical protein